MKKIDMQSYTVFEQTDRNQEPMIARFDNNEAAQKLLPFVGGYGGRIQIERIEITIYSTVDEYFTDKGDLLRRSSLSKLTKEERFALGL